MDRAEPLILTVNAVSPLMTVKTVNKMRKCMNGQRELINGNR